MKHKTLLLSTLLILFFASCSSTKNTSNSNKKGKEKIVLISTNYGDMKVKLYNETPVHRDNFLNLVKQGFYDSLTFHRVIQNFMIQGGDPDTRLNKTAENDTINQDAKTLPAEFVEGLFHKKGALAAARMGDNVNPEKKSSPYQFYIVHGQVLNDEKLGAAEKRSGHTIPEEHKAVYKTLGGTPHLDQNYTVFGEVIEGIYVIDKIAAIETAKADVPIKDVIMTMKIVKK